VNLAVQGVRREGGLLSDELLAQVAGSAAAGQKAADFGLPRGAQLAAAISEAWADACDYWSVFQRRLEHPSPGDPYGTRASRLWMPQLLGLLGFAADDLVPVQIVGFAVDLDRRPPQGGPAAARSSPQRQLQDRLNQSEGSPWGWLANGSSLRLLRQTARTARAEYLEFDLRGMFLLRRFSEFALLYRLGHRSRFPSADEPHCWLERYQREAIEQGARVREKLGQGVQAALDGLGTAFLRHPGNADLRQRLESGKLDAPALHRQLLMLVYRLLFLMVAEERHLIVAADAARQRVYDEHYGVGQLRDRAAAVVEESEFSDLWRGLRRAFALLGHGGQGNPLGIPPLNGGLFDQSFALPDLARAELHNHDLLLGLRHLGLFRDRGELRRVNYAALDVEELGSVYEGLLNFTPCIAESGVDSGPGLRFKLRAGSERKRTGSYYTSAELVAELVESALMPVVRARVERAGPDPAAREQALLAATVCDPACGSGHFLLAAGRRLGAELARLRADGGEAPAEVYHQALREVIAHCLYGVDLNPLAVDLCQLALWLEGHTAGAPLSFLDHHIRCGNSLVGVLDPGALEAGIPDEAFAPVGGDDKAVAKRIKARNKRERISTQSAMHFEESAAEVGDAWDALDALGEATAADVRRKAERYRALRSGAQAQRDESAAHLWTAQFLQPLTPAHECQLCTTEPLREFLASGRIHGELLGAAAGLAAEQRFFHWRVEFPAVFERGGFDVVLGNPPWERIKLQEEEHWADDPWILGAQHKAERERRIAAYANSTEPAKRERHARFERARHASEAAAKFMRASGRFPLSSAGDINTYALFAELARQLVGPNGRVGMIVQTGIATDFTYQRFFADLVMRGSLVSLIDLENRDGIFPGMHRTHPKFCLLTLSAQPVAEAQFGFFLTRADHARDPWRTFPLTAADFALLNPNTRTTPVFRTRVDAALTKKIYRQVPVLVNHQTGVNPWGVSFQRMFDMSNDSDLFKTREILDQLGGGLEANRWIAADGAEYWPLYEGKMLHQLDHRWATWDGDAFRDATAAEKADPGFEPLPRYWVRAERCREKLGEERPWLLAFRDITNASNECTFIAALLPPAAVGNKAPLMLVQDGGELLAAALCSTILDFAARQKVGGTNMNFFIVEQLPVLPPSAYRAEDLSYIRARALALNCTSRSMAPLARALGGEVAAGWDETARAGLRAELDAYFAHLYGLTRLELRYLLDPADVFGAEFPGETFRVLKESELRELGEYRTQRLALAAFDQLAASERFAA